MRFQGSTEPELLEVRSGLLGHRLRLIPVGDVVEIQPKQRRVIVEDSTHNNEKTAGTPTRRERR